MKKYLYILLILLCTQLQSNAIDMQNLNSRQFITLNCNVDKFSDLLHITKVCKFESSTLKKVNYVLFNTPMTPNLTYINNYSLPLDKQ